MRGVVAQWYHWADKSATAMRDPLLLQPAVDQISPSCPLSALLSQYTVR